MSAIALPIEDWFRVCDVHRLVDGDTKPRLCEYCGLCDSWICKTCWRNWPKRALAAIRRKLEMAWITVIDESANQVAASPSVQSLLTQWSANEDFIAPGASISIIQHKSATCSATTCAVTFTSNNASGNLLVYLCGDNSSNVALGAFTDNNSNTISNATSQTTNGGATRIDFVASSRSGPNTVTCSSGGATGVRLHTHVWEIGGTTGTKDQTNTGSQAATSQSISTSGATTAANEVVFGFFYDQPNNDSLTAGSGFNSSEFTDGGGGNESAMSEAKIVSSTGTQTATATCGSATDTILQTIATFK